MLRLVQDMPKMYHSPKIQMKWLSEGNIWECEDAICVSLSHVLSRGCIHATLWMFVIIFVTKWTSDSSLAVCCNMSPVTWWPVGCEPLSPSDNQRPVLGWADQSEASIYCNRREINDPLTCGHRSHSDKLLAANSWSASVVCPGIVTRSLNYLKYSPFRLVKSALFGGS